MHCALVFTYPYISLHAPGMFCVFLMLRELRSHVTSQESSVVSKSPGENVYLNGATTWIKAITEIIGTLDLVDRTSIGRSCDM